MTFWGYAVLAYLLLALNGIFDKFLLSKAVKAPAAFAFWASIFAPLIVVLAPFGLMPLSFWHLIIALLAGFAFSYATYFLYKGIQETSISRIMPIEGGLVPLFTLIVAYFVLNERLTGSQLLAFVFLVIGAVLISIRKEESSWKPKALGNATLAALLFALSFVFTKMIYDVSNFATGMIWTRAGVFLAALSLLINPRFRREIRRAPKETEKKHIGIYYGSRVIGVIGGWLQNFAISIGSVTIVNALQGTQFAFLLIISTFLSVYFPRIIKEKLAPSTIIQKLFAIVLITIGLYLLSI